MDFRILHQSAIVVGLALAAMMPSPAGAQDRHDRSLEKAAAKRVARELGEIRGSIAPEARDFLHSPDADKPVHQLGFPIIEEKSSRKKTGLPPVVMIIGSAQRQL